ncbi:MAG: porin [Candidatus Aminicenantes bacterium RBG_16_66_30]
MRAALGKTGLALLVAVLAAGPGLAEETKDSPAVTALKSLKLSGYAQMFGVAWDRGTDTFSLRRARIALAGGIVKDLRFKLSVDVAKSPTLLDAEIEFEPAAVAGVRFGQFRVPFSLESYTSTADLDLVNRSSVVEALAPGRDNLSSGRDVGVVLFGRVSFLEYTLGFVNGAGINKTDTNSHKDFSGRVILRPFAFLAVGGSLYRGRQTAVADEPLTVRDKEALEAVLSIKGFSLKSEYLHARDDLVSRSGWYAQAGYFAFPGKIQAVVRYDSLDLDRAVPDNGTAIITLGLNWFIAGKTKLQVNYEIHRLESGGRTKSGLMAQFQAAF